jgi:hypothetical protein
LQQNNQEGNSKPRRKIKERIKHTRLESCTAAYLMSEYIVHQTCAGKSRSMTPTLPSITRAAATGPTTSAAHPFPGQPTKKINEQTKNSSAKHGFNRDTKHTAGRGYNKLEKGLSLMPPTKKAAQKEKTT